MNRTNTEKKFTEIEMLPAFHGDCFIIKTFDSDSNEFIIIIDGGTTQTFRYSLKNRLEDISHIDLLILTHIDSDHISGLISFFKNSLIQSINIKEIWINNPDLIEVNRDELISVRQGDNFKDLILSKKEDIKISQITTSLGKINRDGIEFEILSPTQDIVDALYKKWSSKKIRDEESQNIDISIKSNTYLKSLSELSLNPYSNDKSIMDDIFNASSISFLIKCPDTTILMLADSRPEIIISSLRELGFSEENPLVVDYVKVSHHGSIYNTSQELLNLIKCDKYMISTNGGTANHQFPSRETIARIVYNSNRSNNQLKIYFNYSIETIKNKVGNFITAEDLENGNWNTEHRNNFSNKEF